MILNKCVYFCEDLLICLKFVVFSYMTDIETHGKKHPHAVLKNLEEYLAKKKSAANLENVNLGEEQFMSVVDSETAGHYWVPRRGGGVLFLYGGEGYFYMGG